MSHIGVSPAARQVSLPGAPTTQSAKVIALGAVAEGLGILDTAIGESAKQFTRGRNTALQEQAQLRPGQTIKEAIDSGLIREAESETFLGFLNSARGMQAGEIYVQEFSKAFNSSPSRTSEDPAAYSFFTQEFKEGFLRRQDNDSREFRTALEPFIRQIHQNKLNEHVGIVSSLMRQEAIAFVTNEARKLVAKGADPNLFLGLREGVRTLVLTNRETAIALTQGVVEAAIEKSNPDLLNILMLPGLNGAPSIVATYPEVRELIIDTQDALALEARQERAFRRTEQNNAKQDKIIEVAGEEFLWALLGDKRANGEELTEEEQNQWELLDASHPERLSIFSELVPEGVEALLRSTSRGANAMNERLLGLEPFGAEIRRNKQSEEEALFAVRTEGANLTWEFYLENAQHWSDSTRKSFLLGLRVNPIIQGLKKTSHAFRSFLKQAENLVTPNLLKELSVVSQAAQEEATSFIVVGYQQWVVDAIKRGVFKDDSDGELFIKLSRDTLKTLLAEAVIQIDVRAKQLTRNRDVTIELSRALLLAETREKALSFGKEERAMKLSHLNALGRLIREGTAIEKIDYIAKTQPYIRDLEDQESAADHFIAQEQTKLRLEFERAR